MGYGPQTPWIAQFIVSVGPGSTQRGCAPITSDDTRTRNYTRVEYPFGVQPSRYPTKSMGKTPSPMRSRQGWTDYTFYVNNGTGNNVQAILIEWFSVGSPETDCAFEVFFRDGIYAEAATGARAQ